MANWLHGECLFDPSPEDIARYGIYEHIPEGEKVLWIGRPTGLSYLLCTGNSNIILLSVSTFFAFPAVFINKIGFTIVSFFIIIII